MDKSGNRQETIALIQSLQRHIHALVALGGHESEIAACEKAIDALYLHIDRRFDS